MLSVSYVRDVGCSFHNFLFIFILNHLRCPFFSFMCKNLIWDFVKFLELDKISWPDNILKHCCRSTCSLRYLVMSSRFRLFYLLQKRSQYPINRAEWNPHYNITSILKKTLVTIFRYIILGRLHVDMRLVHNYP